MNRFLLILLGLFLCLDVYFISQGNDANYRFFTKTLLLPILLVYYLKSSAVKDSFFIYGLILSFFGDLFLLFSWGFIPGLGSFLFAHIFYIVAFRSYAKKNVRWLIPILLLYVIGFITFLFPYLGDFKIPVIVYAVTIATMLYVAVATANKWLIFGALFFVISDSILSINIFYESSIIREMMVMMTYVVAQILLVCGIKQVAKQ